MLLLEYYVILMELPACGAAALAVFLDSKDLETTAQQVLQQLDARSCKPEISRTYMQTVAALRCADGSISLPVLQAALVQKSPMSCTNHLPAKK